MWIDFWKLRIISVIPENRGETRKEKKKQWWYFYRIHEKSCWPLSFALMRPPTGMGWGETAPLRKHTFP